MPAARHAEVFAGDLPILEDQIARSVSPDEVLPAFLLERELVAEVRAFDHPDFRARGAEGRPLSFGQRRRQEARIVTFERDDDAPDLNLVARHHQAAAPGIERHVSDRAIRTERDERDLADPRVLAIDAGDVHTNVAMFTAADRQKTRAQLQTTCFAETSAGGDDQVHERPASHVRDPSPRGGVRELGHAGKCTPDFRAMSGQNAKFGFGADNETNVSEHPDRPMDPGSQERRTRRSADPLVALHYQLASTRARGDLDAVVVADASGVVVAGAGSWPTCEEIAAYAPLLADGAWADVNESVSSRVESLRREIEVRSVSIGNQDVLLCARRHRHEPVNVTSGVVSSGGSIEANETVARSLDQAAAGISRILKEAA